MSAILIATLCLPYLATAATVADSDSDVFTGIVAPGYSMGGVEVAAYGVDINSWGQVSTDKFVQSDYGIWSGSRAQSAQRALDGDESFIALSEKDSRGYSLDATDKSRGWQIVTGRSNYSLNHPEGTQKSSQSNQYDSVAPYRTVSDWVYWDSKLPSTSASSSADVEVSLYADFIIVGVSSDGKAVSVRSPDSRNAQGGGVLYKNGSPASDAVPYYVPLSALCEEYGITESKDASLSSLLDAIARDGDSASKLGAIAQSSNLLDATRYTNWNRASSAGEESSGAFNPFPYSMVFSSTEKGVKVVSSIYSNSEAYVYFSPSSAYDNYTALQKEYGYIAATEDSSKPATIFKLGYYLAEMEILEAYLEESLPQDMTRGYVGPSESRSLYGSVPGEGTSPNVPGGGNAETPASYRVVSYSTLTYDVANGLTRRGVAGTSFSLASTNAIMDTLSVFGYSTGANRGLGVMKGMDRDTTFKRLTTYSPYSNNALTNKTPGEDVANAGLYVPPYYPIQAHKLPEIEKVYRFPIVASLPYDTMLTYLKEEGFSGQVTLLYGAGAIGDITTTNANNLAMTSAERSRNLASAFDSLDSMTSTTLAGAYKQLVEGTEEHKEKSIALNTGSDIQGFTAEEYKSSVAEDAPLVTAARIDSALLAYQSSSMSPDNVHDMLDVIRSVSGIKNETWARFYNPLKSNGQDSDIFLSRSVPAVTTYMPSIMSRGYVAAGGNEVDVSCDPMNASFDYFAFPSLGACLASHSSSSCYYGSMNYELRAFYSTGFMNTISESVSIPQLEEYENANQDLLNLRSRSLQVWNDVITLYVLAKRLAYIETIYDMKYDNDYEAAALGISSDKAAPNGKVYTWPEMFKENNELYFSDEKGEDWPIVMKPVGRSKEGYWDADAPSVANPTGNEHIYRLVNQSLPTYAASTQEEDDELIRKGTEWLKNKPTIDSVTDTKVSLFNSDWLFIPKSAAGKVVDGYTVVSGTPASDKEIQVTEIGEEKFSILFTYKYDERLAAYLGEGGEFYWTGTKTLVDKAKTGGYSTTLSDDHGKFRYPIEVFLHGVAFDTSIPHFKDKRFNSRAEVGAHYRQLIRDANHNITGTVKQILGDRQTVRSMPTQITNVIGWATDKTASASEDSYVYDPSDDMVIVNEGDNTTIASDIIDGAITSIVELQKYKCSFDAETGKILPDEALLSNMSLDHRMVRGVEGASYLATLQPSCYSISATVQRISEMMSYGNAAYPYAGLCNGRLAAGTSQYAVLEGHSLDYSKLENGLAGDLSLTSPNRAVTVTNPEYTGVEGFVTNISNVGAYFGEMGTSMLKAMSGVFDAAFFKADRQVSTDTSTVSSPAANIAYGGYAASMDTRMTPAAMYVYDIEADALVPAKISGNANSSSSGAAQASAEVQTIGNWANNVLVGKGYAFYALLQEIGLMIVMVSLLVIAFKNFYAYALSDTRNSNIIAAQTKLKVVLPRAIIAIFMIGLPPLSADSTGFQGGAFLLCQVLGTVIGYVSNIFVNLDGAGLMGLWDFTQEALGSDIFSYAAFLTAAVVIGAMFLLGTVCVVVQSLCLMGFYVTAPLVWALYVWPTPAAVDASRSGGILSKLAFGPFTGGRAGNMAPAGWIAGYCSVAVLTIAWSFMFWVASMLFAGTGGLGTAGYMPGSIAAPLSNTGYSTASASLLASGMFGAGNGASLFNVVFITVVAVAVFMLMARLMRNVFASTAKTTVLASSALGGAITSELANRSGRIETRSSETGIGDRPASDTMNVRHVLDANIKVQKQALRTREQAQPTRGADGRLGKPVSGAMPVSDETARIAGMLSSRQQQIQPEALRAMLAEAHRKIREEETAKALAAAAKAVGELTDRQARVLAYNAGALGSVLDAMEIAEALKSADIAERSRILAAASPDAIRALRDAGILLENGAVDVAVLADGSGMAELAAREGHFANALAAAATSEAMLSEQTARAVSELESHETGEALAESSSSSERNRTLLEHAGSYMELPSEQRELSEKARNAREHAERRAASTSALTLGSFDDARKLAGAARLNSLNEQVVQHVSNLDIGDVEAVGALAAAIASGYVGAYKSLGSSDARAAGKALNAATMTIEAASANLPLAAAKTVSEKKGKVLGGAAAPTAGAVLVPRTLREIRTQAAPFSVGESSVPMNVLKACAAMNVIDFEDPEQAGRFSSIKFGVKISEMARGAKVLKAATDMMDSVVNVPKPQVVKAFFGEISNRFTEQLAQDEAVIGLMNGLAGASTVNDGVKKLAEPAIAREYPGLSEGALDIVRDRVGKYYASEEMLHAMTALDGVAEYLENEGVDVAGTMPKIDEAMALAHSALPAYVIDAQTRGNDVASELVEKKVMLSDFSYAAVKDASMPMSVSDVAERAGKVIGNQYGAFDEECQRYGLGGATGYRIWKRTIDDMRKYLTEHHMNFRVEDIEQAYIDLGECKTPAEAQERASELMAMTLTVNELTTQGHIDAFRFTEDASLLADEINAAAAAGFSMIISEGADNSASEALPGSRQPKMLQSVVEDEENKTDEEEPR